MYQFSTLVDLLSMRAQNQPDLVAYTFLQDGETESAHLSYKELEQQARAIAVQLQNMNAAGSRALLLYPPGLDFLAAFFGCLYASVVAVPAYPPRPNQSLSRLQAIVDDSQATFALTTKAMLDFIRSRRVDNSEFSFLKWIATDNITLDLASDWHAPNLTSEMLAFLQYTSGSTGSPKGVMVNHGNILHNSELIKKNFAHTPNSQVVSWLPVYHDMGLIGGILQPLYIGAPMVLMPALAFIQKPIRWLKAITRYRTTTSGGPNFAYDLCCRKITEEQRSKLDLSSWEVAFTGAEPIRAETLELFARTFADCGFNMKAFHPCYGMAETTLIISGSKKLASPIVKHVDKAALEQNQVVIVDSIQSATTKAVVGCGECLEDEVLIVEPETLTPCLENQIGEIWVSNPSVAGGYWNQSDLTQETFHAQLRNSANGRQFLRTGDLGFLHNSELFVTSRLKDLIIIRGRNHYPQDIELTVEQSHPALRPSCSAAFSVDIEGQERLVVACEVERTFLRKLDLDALGKSIYQALIEQYELEVYAILLLKTGSIPKTSSGKIQRHACRAGFLYGNLDVVGDWRTNPQSKVESWHQVEEVEFLEQQQSSLGTHNGYKQESYKNEFHKTQAIQAWLVSNIAQRLQINPYDIDVQQPFSHYGLDSVATVSLSSELGDWLGCRLSPTLIYDYPNIEALVRHLAEKIATSAATLDVDVLNETETEPKDAKASDSAIAIISLGCRFPGANNATDFWQLLRDGVDAITEVPASRWDTNAVYNSESATQGKMSTRWGGFLDQVDQFDPHFFGISPREAERIDPQQRLLLEVAWEALENTGQAPNELAGSQTGVFIGISNSDYSRFQFEDFARIDAYASTGNAFSIAANRLSYLLDLRGPSLAVDTACSSSLVAVHLACQSLRNGECNLAIAGGVNLILSPELTISFSQARMMATDGRCKTFDANADGYVRGEGCGVVLLKRLSDALQDGDNILAVIRGSAINQDGRSNGLTAPNGPSQQVVIRQALEHARVTPSQISYVEAHGTGTSLGDPIEVESLKAVLMSDRSPDQPCVLGSVKSNIGHLEAAAGIASLIKVVLSLQHREIPPQLHFNQLNPYISLQDTSFSIPKERQPWLTSAKRRFAGVSSFGFGGTNAHVILEEPPVLTSTANNIERPLHLLTLSAKSDNALRSLVNLYQKFLEVNLHVAIADVCFTANTGRSHFKHRLAVVAESNIQLRERLLAFADSKEAIGIVSGQIDGKKHSKIAFLFTGQGSQYVDMGRQLYETQPIFRQALELCDKILCPYLGTSLLKIIYPNTKSKDSELDKTAYTQPALFALEYALCQLWKSWGVEPAAVMGHSVGEYVAACVAGVFSLEDGLKLIAERARLMQALPENGEMVAVMAGSDLVNSLIKDKTKEVAIAALNGSSSTVISGATPAIREICAQLNDKGIKFKKLEVSHAFHSPLMQPMLADFEVIANQVTYNRPQIPLISNLTGKRVDDTICTPQYWLNHILQPVQFVNSINCLNQHDHNIYLEIGPKPVLLGIGCQCLPENMRLWLPSLRSPQTDWQQMLQSLALLYINGVSVDWKGFDKDYNPQKVALPTYPFERKRYWLPEIMADHNINTKEFSQTSIIKLLHQGDTQGLAQRLAGEIDESLRSDLPQILSVLVKCHQQEINSTLIKDWFYQVEWQPKQRHQNKDINFVSEIGTWLILCDEGNLGTSLAQTLQQQGHNCLLVYQDESYGLKNSALMVNPSHPEDFEHLLHEVLVTNQQPLKGVINLWSLNATPTTELTISTLQQAQTAICSGTLHLIQSLIKCNLRPRLWILTRGAIAIDSVPPNIVQAPVWGFGGVIALEHPELWGGMLDLAPQPNDDEAGEILAEIFDSQGEDYLALRSKQRYVARLLPKEVSLTNRTPLVSNKKDATYLITGGLGALGLKVAQWMVEQGARNLVLIGRSQASPQTREIIAKMEQAGVKVILAQANVCKQADLVKVLQEIKASMSSLKGIVHAAGVLIDKAITSMSWSDFERVMSPKVLGGWNLHQLTQDIELDFFVSFSSLASWGARGQANYAAANYFLDTLADYRQSLGKPGLSINWGSWAEVGMAVGKVEQFLSRTGIRAMKPEQALAALGIAIEAGSARTIIADIDWKVFNEIYKQRGKRALLEKIVLKSGENAETSQKNSDVLQKLLDATVSDRQYELLFYLQSKIAKILNLANIEKLNLHQPLNDMGFDSLMAIELRNWVQASFNVEVSIVKFMDKLSTLDLAAYISEQITNIRLISEESVLIAQQLQTAPTNQQLENREEIEL